MPGRSLSRDEERLLRFWEAPPADLPRPQLRAMEISGGDGLRALNGLRIPFKYPITAICGKNGTGKSTALSLATLAFHTPANWYVPWTNSRQRSSKSQEDRSYYVFPDFFVYGRGEPVPNGVQITWRYITAGPTGAIETSIQFKKTAKAWGNYARRPEREIAYSPLSRMIPATEMNSVRGEFQKPGGHVVSAKFDRRYRSYLAYIMGVKYEDVETLKTDRLSFSACKTDVDYSAFNMGGGESCLIELLRLLSVMPPFGLLAVEEIESCLHPEAQVRLAHVLTKVCLEKKIQIICSTHSDVFLDSLPRQARLLLTRANGSTSVMEGPSTRFALYEMTGTVQPELTIYCEDRAAATLLDELVSYDDRRRLRIIDVGSDATVVRQAVSHLRGSFPGRCLCILDGDCTHTKVQSWITSERGAANLIPDYAILPGDEMPPEKWVLAQLAHDNYRNQLAIELGCSRDQAAAHVQAMSIGLDHHNIGHTLHKRTNLEKVDCTRRVMRSVARNHPALDPIKTRIREILG